MLKKRVIPCLLLKNESLIKTERYRKYNYIGDPVNTVRIFNELGVDELILLDIFSSVKKTEINFSLLENIANECFMPLSYGGGIDSIEKAKKIFSIGFEKIIVNSAAFDNLEFIEKLCSYFGSQSIIASIDARKNLFKNYAVYSHRSRIKRRSCPIEWAKCLESAGVGEIMLTSVDRESSWSGYDVELTREVASSVKVPVMANGGAGTIKHIEAVFNQGMAAAAVLGSMIVYQKKGMGVLVNFPDKDKLSKLFV